MGRPLKRFTDEELLMLPERKLEELAERGLIDDDDWQRWHDLKEEAYFEARWFEEHELKHLQSGGE